MSCANALGVSHLELQPGRGRHPEPKAKDVRISDQHGTRTQNYLGIRFALWLGSFLFLASSLQARGQGCAQCLDSTHATPPAVQASYRHAIYLLGGTGVLLFVVGTLIIRRER